MISFVLGFLKFFGLMGLGAIGFSLLVCLSFAIGAARGNKAAIRAMEEGGYNSLTNLKAVNENSYVNRSPVSAKERRYW